jgi:hypothetical protein
MSPIPTPFQEDFYAIVRLLSLLRPQGQHDPVPATDEQTRRDELLHWKGPPYLQPPTNLPPREFLDRIALIFAHSKKDCGPHVTATVFVRSTEGMPKIYIAKNRSLTLGDENLRLLLQAWLRSPSLKKADIQEYDALVLEFWQEMVMYNVNVIEHYIDRIANSKQNFAPLFHAGSVREQAKSLRNECYRLKERRKYFGRELADYVAQRQNVLCLSYWLRQQMPPDSQLTGLQQSLKHYI